jgi:hypothetical protein
MKQTVFVPVAIAMVGGQQAQRGLQLKATTAKPGQAWYPKFLLGLRLTVDFRGASGTLAAPVPWWLHAGIECGSI